jgi:hypothetical protein
MDLSLFHAARRKAGLRTLWQEGREILAHGESTISVTGILEVRDEDGRVLTTMEPDAFNEAMQEHECEAIIEYLASDFAPYSSDDEEDLPCHFSRDSYLVPSPTDIPFFSELGVPSFRVSEGDYRDFPYWCPFHETLARQWRDMHELARLKERRTELRAAIHSRAGTHKRKRGDVVTQ